MSGRALFEMGRRAERILADETVTQNPTGEDERVSPPLVHLSPTFERGSDARGDPEVLWVGPGLVKAPRLGSGAVATDIGALANAHESVAVAEETGDEYDLTVGEDHAGPATVVDVTRALFSDVYAVTLDDPSAVEWDDIPNRERLTAPEFRRRYGDA